MKTHKSTKLRQATIQKHVKYQRQRVILRNKKYALPNKSVWENQRDK